jgi:hypothetical protein
MTFAGGHKLAHPHTHTHTRHQLCATKPTRPRKSLFTLTNDSEATGEDMVLAEPMKANGPLAKGRPSPRNRAFGATPHMAYFWN